MAMTSQPMYGGGMQQRNSHHHRSSLTNYTINLAPSGVHNGTPSSSNPTSSSHRKSAVELLAESKAFYVKSETVRGRTQTLPLLSHNRRHRANTIGDRMFTSTIREHAIGVPSTGLIQTSSLNRRSTSSGTSSLNHPTNADMLQNALRKLLDCGSPVTSIENVAHTNQSSTSASNDISFDMDCTTPISPPAEYAFCASASERRYTTRSLSHSQPVSASSTKSQETTHPDCCSNHLVVLAKSLPDLHTARTLNNSFEGSRSNKSTTSDVFSLNRDSGGDSSGHLTHKSEPVVNTRRYVTQDKYMRRDSGSSTQHSNSYYYTTKKPNYYEPQATSTSYFCRVTKHGYPVPMMPMARTEPSPQIQNDQKIIRNSSSSSSGVNNPRSSSSSSTNKKRHQASLLFESPTNELILPPPIECSTTYSNIVFMDTIIPPPVFQNDSYYEPPPPILPPPPSHYKDNISDSSFHENVQFIPPPSNPVPFQDPELSPGPGTFKRQKCFRYKKPTSTPPSQSTAKPILRSKSDISDRYRRPIKSPSTLIRKSCGGEISRSVSHLEQFFEQLGLNSDTYDTIFINANSRSSDDSPVYFSDVSTVDSNRPLPPIPTDGEANNNTDNLNTFRSSDQPSIVERNARIIKWLCNCRKAQLATSSTK